MNIFHILIFLTFNLDMKLQQYDIENAFLHGDPKEELYMKIPLGYEQIENETKVCKLRKALYRLKQSPKAWF